MKFGTPSGYKLFASFIAGFVVAGSAWWFCARQPSGNDVAGLKDDLKRCEKLFMGVRLYGSNNGGTYPFKLENLIANKLVAAATLGPESDDSNEALSPATSYRDWFYFPAALESGNSPGFAGINDSSRGELPVLLCRTPRKLSGGIAHAIVFNDGRSGYVVCPLDTRFFDEARP